MKGFISIYLKKCLVPQFSEHVFVLAAIDEQFDTQDLRLVSQCQQAHQWISVGSHVLLDAKGAMVVTESDGTVECGWWACHLIGGLGNAVPEFRHPFHVPQG